MKSIKNIVFDLGRVLINWQPQEIINDTFKHKEKIPHNFIDIVKTQHWIDFDKGFINEQQLIDILKHDYNQQDLEMFIENVTSHLTPLEGGLSILNEIKKHNYNTYILSNFPKYYFENIRKKYDFFNHFDGQVISFEAGSIKPEAKIYHTLFNRYNLEPNQSLFIDDLYVNIEAGKELGMHGIVCDNHENVSNQLRKLQILTS